MTGQPWIGRSVLITGGTGRIGRVLVEAFLNAGYAVVATGRDPDRLHSLDQAGAGRPLTVFAADLAGEDAPRHLADTLAMAGHFPDVFVHAMRDPRHLAVDAAGRPDRAAWLGEYTQSVVVPWELTMALIDLPQSRLDSVVLMSSIYGIVANVPALYGDDNAVRLRPHYGTAKAATIHLTRHMAVALAPRVRVNCVSYGGVAGEESVELRERYARLCPQGRMLKPEEVSSACLFLAAREASGVTGHNAVVDGGWSIW
jgi:NAD(P)-dependent dehydrogenase (short-subunit alcohol dehydrogenase family)